MEIRTLLVRNNGLTSLIPPCFSWDVIDPETGAKITAASEIDLSALSLPIAEENKFRYAMMREEHRIVGSTHETAPLSPSGHKAVVLVVQRVKR